MFPAVAKVDLNLATILAVFLILFFYLHAGRIRASATIMADSARPETPSRKLFKPSNKVKTPTSVKRLSSSSISTPQSPSKDSTPEATMSNKAVGSTKKQLKLGDSPKFVRKFSTPVVPAQSTTKSSFPPFPHFDDIAKSTTLAPLTSGSKTASRKFAQSVASDTASDTPIGLIDNVNLTPTDTGTDAARNLSRNTSENMTGATGPLTDHTSHTSVYQNETSEPVSVSTTDLKEKVSTQDTKVEQRSGVTDNARDVASKPTETLRDVAGDLPVDTDSPTETLNPNDLANHFAEHGHSEMSDFIKALTQASQDSITDASGADATKDSSENLTKKARDLANEASDPMLELPTDDGLANDAVSKAEKSSGEVIQSAPDLTNVGKAIGGGVTLKVLDATGTGDDTVGDKNSQIPGASSGGQTCDVVGNAKREAPDSREVSGDLVKNGTQGANSQPTTEGASSFRAPQLPSPPGVSQDSSSPRDGTRTTGLQDLKGGVQPPGSAPVSNTFGIPNDVKEVDGGASNGFTKDIPVSTTPPDVSKITDRAKELSENIARKPSYFTLPGQQAPDASEAPRQAQGAVTDIKDKITSSGGTQRVDNYGKPARVNRSMEFPLPRPEAPSRAKRNNSSYADLSGVPGVHTLRGTKGLSDVDDLDDPPEEFLDPAIHSPNVPSANISPIPKISKIAPITSQPPPDLSRLANGLGGNTVDDVGNIVDESGKVVGHATGDLPAMIGKKVAHNGEIYGDMGELIGFVTENLTGHPPPPPPPPSNEAPLPGGLKVDSDGNILDRTGTVIGKLHKKPSQSGLILPHNNPTADAPKMEAKSDEPEDEENPKENNTGIPADIFLDVKSTPDGIQLTIRIPTVFKQETQKRPES